MSTSNGPIRVPEVPTADHRPPRLRIVEHPGTDPLDGGWWPRSRDLAVELADLVDLVDQFPARSGRIVRALVSPADWGPAPQHVPATGGDVEVGALPSADRHLLHLATADQTVLRLLVVPPDFTQDQGDEALLAAATAGNAHSAMDLLDEVTEYPDTHAKDHWTDDGEPWWGPHPVAPSFRTGR
jgi:hypothetical protein